MYSNFIPKPYLQAKKGGSCCMAGASNDVSWKINTYTVAVSMHYFPKNEAVHRQKWIRFTGRHHKDFKPSNLTVLFSVHFEDSCFEHRPITVLQENGEFIHCKKGLMSGSIPIRDMVIPPYSSPPTSPKYQEVSRLCVLHVHLLKRMNP